MSATDSEFRWTLGLSLLAHATVLAAVGFAALLRGPLPRTQQSPADVWFGTTVTVVEAPREDSVPPQPESGSPGAVSELKKSDPNEQAATGPRLLAEPRKIRARTSSSGNVDIARQEGRQPARRADREPTPLASSRERSSAGTGMDLRQAMQNSLNQGTSESGTFGAAGVDLTERRLPKAFTRALPVAIGAEPGWWKQHPGPLGSIRFKVALSETGKLEEVTFEDENKHPFHVRVVRRVAKLLALGTFALPSSTTGSAEQAFELRLVMEQREPDADSTADPGDLVEKGFEPPSVDKPGQAIIRDAPGHTMRAFLKLLKARGSFREAPDNG